MSESNHWRMPKADVEMKMTDLNKLLMKASIEDVIKMGEKKLIEVFLETMEKLNLHDFVVIRDKSLEDVIRSRHTLSETALLAVFTDHLFLSPESIRIYHDLRCMYGLSCDEFIIDAHSVKDSMFKSLVCAIAIPLYERGCKIFIVSDEK